MQLLLLCGLILTGWNTERQTDLHKTEIEVMLRAFSDHP